MKGYWKTLVQLVGYHGTTEYRASKIRQHGLKANHIIDSTGAYNYKAITFWQHTSFVEEQCLAWVKLNNYYFEAIDNYKVVPVCLKFDILCDDALYEDFNQEFHLVRIKDSVERYLTLHPDVDENIAIGLVIASKVGYFNKISQLNLEVFSYRIAATKRLLDLIRNKPPQIKYFRIHAAKDDKNCYLCN